MPSVSVRAHRLAERQIAGGGERQNALARLGVDVQLAEGGDVVEAGIGARVGDHHQAVAHQNSAAIGHSDRPLLALLAGRYSGARVLSQCRRRA